MNGEDPACSPTVPRAPLQIRTRKKHKKRNRKWTSLLDAVEIGPYRFMAITCTNELRREGQIMEHCVQCYEELCRLDCAKIFSVRDALTDKRIATLSLLWERDYWHLDQIKGFKNEEVVCEESTYFDGDRTVTKFDWTDAHYAAQELLVLYRNAWQTRKDY